MEACPEYRETLWLDVHGELKAGERREWEEHLQECDGCRKERTRLARLLDKTRDSLRPEDYSPEESARLSEAILRKTARDRGRWWRIFDPLLPGGPKPAYALVAVCLAVLAFGWFRWEPGRNQAPLRTASGTGKENVSQVGEAEMLQNLGLLEELEVIEKVVKLVDRRDVSM